MLYEPCQGFKPATRSLRSVRSTAGAVAVAPRLGKDSTHSEWQAVYLQVQVRKMPCWVHTFESCRGGGPTWCELTAMPTGRRHRPKDRRRTRPGAPERPTERRPAHGGPPDQARTTPRQQKRRTRPATANYTQLHRTDVNLLISLEQTVTTFHRCGRRAPDLLQNRAHRRSGKIHYRSTSVIKRQQIAAGQNAERAVPPSKGTARSGRRDDRI